MANSVSDQPKYRADIDGLRSVAIIPVLLYHAGLVRFSGGFVGVDIFFVISGYLITGILHRENQAGRFSLSSFYERRIRRIVPALVVVIFACSITAFLVMLPEDLSSFGKSAVAALMSFSNVTFGLEGTGYFQTQAELKPLLHTWSLGVEEQFYLAFPLFLWVLHRLARRWLVPALWTAALLSFVLGVVLTFRHPSVAFYLSLPRAWELLLGSLLAVECVPRIGSAAAREILAFAGLILIAAAILLYSPATPFPGMAAAIPCIGTALVIQFAPGTACGKLLSLRPMVFVGLISYSLYLWHWPVLAFARYALIRELGTAEALAALLVAFVLAIVSWRFVERPFRGRAVLGSKRRLFPAASAAIAICAAPPLLFLIDAGLPSRLPAQIVSVSAARGDIAPDRDRCLSLSPEAFAAGRYCRLGVPGRPNAVLWGDSHAGAIAPAFADIAAGRGLAMIMAGHSSCPPIAGLEVMDNHAILGCRQWNQAVLAAARSPEIGAVFLVARWTSYARGTGFGSDAYKRFVTHPDGVRALLHGLGETLGALGGKRVYLVLSVPEQLYDAPSALARRRLFGSTVPLDLPLRTFEARQSAIREGLLALAQRYRVTVVDPASILCDSVCHIEKNGRPLYSDNNHLSTYGARTLVGAVARAWVTNSAPYSGR